MRTPFYLLIVLLVAVAFIVLATSRLKWHPFIVLLMASYGIGFGAGMDPLEIGATIRDGFGGILGYIGLVILIEAGPVYHIFMADIRGTTLSSTIWLWTIGSFAAAFIGSLLAIALPMRFGERRLSKRLI